jgi:uncharacterized protein YndB with AHSA1/START domain
MSSRVVRWRVPFDARVGGRFRVSLTYDLPTGSGKTAADTDTYRGHFAELVPGERVVEVMAFETGDEALGSTMTMTTTLADVPGGTEVVIVHDGIPDAVRPEDIETGTRTALARLASLVERPSVR